MPNHVSQDLRVSGEKKIFGEDREYQSTDDEYEKNKKYTNKSK